MGRSSFPVAIAVCLFAASCSRRDPASLSVDDGIASELAHITAIDNHAHPVKVTSAGEDDRDFDALPADAIQDPALPAPFSNGSSYFAEADQALFGTTKDISGRKAQEEKSRGDLYPSWVLNKTNTDIMLANRVAMGRGLPNDRFKWVPFVDCFLFPLDNAAAKAKDPEHKAFFNSEEALLSRFLREENMKQLPATFDEYLTFISHTLETWKGNGAVALKFEIAYLRNLEISNPQRESAERVYSIYARSSEPTPEEYKILQDYVFRFLCSEAGRLNLPIHIHCAVGVGSYFRVANADPVPLESLFNDPGLRRTRFVMLHGGWPFTREAAALILKPNVYVDMSGLDYLTYPAEAARAIRLYLESVPYRVLYGSDASPFSKDVGWEETAWIGSHYGRLALGVALTGMLRDGEITADRAKELAHMVMRENARQLYGF